MNELKQAFRYKQLAGEIEHKILNGTYKPGEKLLSIRKLHKQSNLSISTVYKTYMELETMGLIEARPKSGYYVNPIALQQLKAPVFKKKSPTPRKVSLSSMINSVVSAINNPNFLPFGNSSMDADLLPGKHFSRILKELSHKDMKSMISYSLSEGDLELRRQVTLRTLGILEGITPDDIIITNGCTEAVALALLAITKPGDTIAIETPTNFSFLQLLKELGVLVMEVPTDPRYGVDIDELEKILRPNKIKTCLFMPNFHNPLGTIMSNDNKRKLCRLLHQYEIPVIEDDISTELYFEEQRPMPLKAFDERDLVLTCSSFSKTLAPGLRIGWIIPGMRFKEKIQRLKGGITVSTSTLNQYLVTQFLTSGAYERHLRSLRTALKKQAIRTTLAVKEFFPPDTRLAVPKGGSFLWIQLNPSVDGVKVYRRALDHNISIIPGVVCSNSRLFKNYIQISFGAPFTSRIEQGIKTLGTLISQSYN